MAAVEGGAKLGHAHPRSKFLKAITSKQQEISGWARQGRPHTEYARQLGQLTENVTLDMMLQEHLYELSRARYKLKVNNRFEKKMFLQRQMTKSSALREKLKNVHFEDSRPKWAQRPVTQPAKKPREPTGPPPSRMQRKSPALPIKTKPDSAPLRRNTALITEVPRAQTRTTFYESGAQRISSPKTERFFQTELDIPTKRRRTPTINESLPTPTNGMIITPGNSKLPVVSTPRDGSKANTPRFHNGGNVNQPKQSGDGGVYRKSMEFYIPPQTAPERLQADTNADQSLNDTKQRRESRLTSQKSKLVSWGEANRAVNDQRFVRDERYLGLERSLTETYFGKKNAPNVDEIVQKISTLHVQPKRRDKRPRVTKQMKAIFADSQPLKAF